MKNREKDKQDIPLPRFGLAFFKIGLTAYGMAILQQLKALIIGNNWLTRKQVDEGIAMVQFYPGPVMYNLTTYCSYRLKGFSGSMLATFLFILPSYLLILFLSWLYFTYGSVAWVHPLFLALEAMVVGVVVNILIDFSKRYVGNGKNAIIAGTAFLLLLYHINALIVILAAVVLEFVFRIVAKEDQQKKKEPAPPDSLPLPGKFSHRLTAIVGTGIIFAAIFLIGLFSHHILGQLLFSMFKIGAVAFGSGFTIMPLLQQEAVVTHHWLTMKQFADGIAFGQITPGPFLITATFIGYKVAGFWGSVVATFGMFFPSFFYTLIVTEIYDNIKQNRWIRFAINGIMSAFTGMLLWVVISLGEVSLTHPISWIFAVGAFILIRYFKLNLLWVFLMGITVSLALFLFLNSG